MVIEHHLQGRHQRTVVLKRLAHAHHDHIGNHPFRHTQFGAEEMLGKPKLSHNFARGEVAAEALMPG